MPRKPYRLLTIAGSDSGGGAGVQADLKTFCALGGYGMSAITALTAQNTKEVRSIYEVPAAFVRDQLEAVLSDIGADAVKIGMLNSIENIVVVTEVLKRYQAKNIVLDPVMVAKSGDSLLRPTAVTFLRDNLFPISKIITPNIPEAEVLLGMNITSQKLMEIAAQKLLWTGTSAVLIKGGHLSGSEGHDCLVHKDEIKWFHSEYIKTKNTHGTGCTLSSAIAAFLAQDFDLVPSIEKAKWFLSQALKSGSTKILGQGSGPIDHLFGQKVPRPLW